jgi:Tfp pilus assembly protein PilZ
MNDKRSFERKRKRLLVDIHAEGRLVSGFTCDLSHTGLFVSSQYVPRLGEKLRATLHLPGEKKVAIEGTVVRIHRVPQALAGVEGNSGFSLALGGYFEDYARYVGGLG